MLKPVGREQNQGQSFSISVQLCQCRALPHCVADCGVLPSFVMYEKPSRPVFLRFARQSFPGFRKLLVSAVLKVGIRQEVSPKQISRLVAKLKQPRNCIARVGRPTVCMSPGMFFACNPASPPPRMPESVGRYSARHTTQQTHNAPFPISEELRKETRCNYDRITNSGELC